MELEKFGSFVAERRRELGLTQKELASKIQVTDKAVSKWERGLGFPDINLVEPLAQGLEVSIVELMKSERIENRNITVEDASAVLADSLETTDKVEKGKRKRTRTALLVMTGFLLSLFLWAAWLVHHPRIDIPYSGKLEHPPVISVGNYFGIREPEIIRRRYQLWQSEVSAQYLMLEAYYEDYDVDYETWYEDGATVLRYTGSGVRKSTGEREEIDWVNRLDFKLYGVPEKDG